MTRPNKYAKNLGILFYLAVILGSGIVIFLCLGSLILGMISERIRIESISMEPALYPGDYAIVNKLAFNSSHHPLRGDVIVFMYPSNSAQVPYVKRIIGLPGDQVHIAEGKIYINGELIVEPYIGTTTHRGGDWTVPAGEYFVLGDNRNNSSDSRAWGYVPDENVIGRLELIYFPPKHWSLLSQNIAFDSSRP
jgi:signal peptidase I